MATTSPLPVTDRDAFLMDLDNRLRRGGASLALALTDLDDFATINETRGRDVGDAVLAGWDRVLRANVPSGSSVARLGGDEFADPRAESVLESCARVVFHEHGLPPPELQVAITGLNFRYYADFYWSEYRVIAETDGKVKYSNPDRAIKQLERDQQLRDNGDKVVHFTWRELFSKPTPVPGRIHKAFGSSSAI